jgi:ferredoxin
MHTDAGDHASTIPEQALTLEIMLPDGGRFKLGTRAGTRMAEVVRDYGCGCGGACDGRSCHLRVGGAWADRLPRPSEAEAGALEGVGGTGRESRLPCQLAMTSDLHGLELQLIADNLFPQTYWIAG